MSEPLADVIARLRADPAFNETAEQAESFAKHKPVRDESLPGALICGWRDPEGRRCGRGFNVSRECTGHRRVRHSPPRGCPHPRSW